MKLIRGVRPCTGSKAGGGICVGGVGEGVIGDSRFC